MKKIVFLLAACLFFSCDDGDLTIEEIDLETTASVQACTTLNNAIPAGTTLVFKINGGETLILELPATLLINEATTTEENEDGDFIPVPRTAALNSQASCYYRSFESSISNAYFCDQLPSDIAITLEYLAVSGTVEVISVPVLDAETMEIIEYNHTITFKEVVFTGTNGQDVRYSEFDFGDVSTFVE
ncbi:hypothetical protein C8N46_10228 [Kordia periserrulae]|uniref:Uncharacterized protein n=1 Tax=Kordia periserrulae TaxID=701523 RepID=A0A2T6C2W1_9FLAO|nr:hypothetical protein [Kordia periserrulae]PTX62633.1 hypothetical protein C8N46_10228 [Kordia periserrulae]